MYPRILLLVPLQDHRDKTVNSLNLYSLPSPQLNKVLDFTKSNQSLPRSALYIPKKQNIDFNHIPFLYLLSLAHIPPNRNFFQVKRGKNLTYELEIWPVLSWNGKLLCLESKKVFELEFLEICATVKSVGTVNSTDQMRREWSRGIGCTRVWRWREGAHANEDQSFCL